MKSHRIRLTDGELDLITSALRARLAGIGGKAHADTEWLAERLEERAPGNPVWRLGPKRASVARAARQGPAQRPEDDVAPI